VKTPSDNLRKSPNKSLVLFDRAKQKFANTVPIKEIASALLVAISTLYFWRKVSRENPSFAPDVKKRGRKVGSGRILTPEEELKLQHEIKTSLPSAFGLNYSTWIRKAISKLALKLFDKKVAERTIGDYLKRWGFSPQIPM
jgi:transposase